MEHPPAYLMTSFDKPFKGYQPQAYFGTVRSDLVITEKPLPDPTLPSNENLVRTPLEKLLIKQICHHCILAPHYYARVSILTVHRKLSRVHKGA